MKSQRNDYLMYTKFLTMITIISFYCCEKVFTLMKLWIIAKNSMKHHYLKKKIFITTKKWKTLLMLITRTQKEFVKILK